jgi:hypothetical protein
MAAALARRADAVGFALLRVAVVALAAVAGVGKP